MDKTEGILNDRIKWNEFDSSWSVQERIRSAELSSVFFGVLNRDRWYFKDLPAYGKLINSVCCLAISSILLPRIFFQDFVDILRQRSDYRWHCSVTHAALMWHPSGTVVALLRHSCDTQASPLWHSSGTQAALKRHCQVISKFTNIRFFT